MVPSFVNSELEDEAEVVAKGSLKMKKWKRLSLKDKH